LNAPYSLYSAAGLLSKIVKTEQMLKAA